MSIDRYFNICLACLMLLKFSNWSVRSFKMGEGDGLKGLGIVTLARCEFNFVREHKNLV